MSDAANVVKFPSRPRPQPLGSLGDMITNLQTAKPGDKGPNVSALQAALKSWGFDPLGIDGDYGPNTTAAVKRLQAALHVTSDGIFGPLTLNAVRTDLGMPHGSLPRPGATSMVATPIPQASPGAQPVVHGKKSPLLWIGVGLSAIAGLMLIAKAFGGDSSSPAPQPHEEPHSAPPPPHPALPANAGVAGGEFFDLSGEEDAEFEEEKPKRKRKRKPAKRKAKKKADPFEDESSAADLPDDYEFEGDDELFEEQQGEREA